jgi:hypothetical protein
MHLTGERRWEVVDLSGLVLDVQGSILGAAVHRASWPVHINESEIGPNSVPLQGQRLKASAWDLRCTWE